MITIYLLVNEAEELFDILTEDALATRGNTFIAELTENINNRLTAVKE